MDIYAKKGCKVIATNLDNGHKHHAEQANNLLKKGETYTVERTKVGNWETYVYLKEIPEIGFNSVHFEDRP